MSLSTYRGIREGGEEWTSLNATTTQKRWCCLAVALVDIIQCWFMGIAWFDNIRIDFHLQIRHHPRRRSAAPNSCRMTWPRQAVSPLWVPRTPSHCTSEHASRTGCSSTQVSGFILCLLRFRQLGLLCPFVSSLEGMDSTTDCHIIVASTCHSHREWEGPSASACRRR